MRPIPVAVALAAIALSIAPGAEARSMDGPHVRAACKDVTIILFTDGHCHGNPGEDGCHGIVIIVASDDNCRGGDGTSQHTAGNGCEDATVVNVAGYDNCQGGEG